MRRTVVWALCVAVLLAGGVARAADKRTAKAVSQYAHICEAASRVSIELVRVLAKHPYETKLASYANKIAEANVYIFKRLKAPAKAAGIKLHFGKAVAAFQKAAEEHLKANYKLSDKFGKECVAEFWKAVAEVRKLRREGVIP
jgi:predicted outer membrane protein